MVSLTNAVVRKLPYTYIRTYNVLLCEIPMDIICLIAFTVAQLSLTFCGPPCGGYFPCLSNQLPQCLDPFCLLRDQPRHWSANTKMQSVVCDLFLCVIIQLYCHGPLQLFNLYSPFEGFKDWSVAMYASTAAVSHQSPLVTPIVSLFSWLSFVGWESLTSTAVSPCTVLSCTWQTICQRVARCQTVSPSGVQANVWQVESMHEQLSMQCMSASFEAAWEQNRWSSWVLSFMPEFFNACVDRSIIMLRFECNLVRLMHLFCASLL